MARKAKATFDPKKFLATVNHGRMLSTYARDAVIFPQAGPADAVFYVQKGRIKIVVESEQGKEAVVMLPLEDFERLSHRRRQPKSLVQFFRESPLAGVKLDFKRDKDPGRDIDL